VAAVNVVVVYESLTGNTQRAAEVIGGELERRGVTATVCNITAIDYQALAQADLVVMGSWVDGIFVIGQRPGRAVRLESFPPIDGKRCFVFCTYALNPGKTLDKMTTIMEGRGAAVLGGMAIKRNRIDDGARDFVGRVLDAVPA
jgi:sulfite reductase alpha subunit-like flavoprotein